MRITKEIRRYLRGRTAIEDGVVVAIDDPRLAIKSWQGATLGSLGTVMLGIAHRKQVYRIDMSQDMEEMFNQFGYAFTHIGRIAVIEEVPDSVGCYRKAGMANPILYTLEREADGPFTLTVTCFTARSIVSLFRTKQAMQIFDDQVKNLGIAVKVELTKEEIAENKAASKEEAKQARMAAREAAKAKKNASLSQHNKIER